MANRTAEYLNKKKVGANTESTKEKLERRVSLWFLGTREQSKNNVGLGNKRK